jgi:hypothetical protein
MQYELLDKGVQHIYFPVEPSRKIVKCQAELKGKKAKIKAVVNLNYKGENYYQDEVTLQDGDSIYAEPDGLVALRDSAQPEFNLTGWDGEYIHLGSYIDGVLMLFVSVEP